MSVSKKDELIIVFWFSTAFKLFWNQSCFLFMTLVVCCLFREVQLLLNVFPPQTWSRLKPHTAVFKCFSSLITNLMLYITASFLSASTSVYFYENQLAETRCTKRIHPSVLLRSRSVRSSSACSIYI